MPALTSAVSLSAYTCVTLIWVSSTVNWFELPASRPDLPPSAGLLEWCTSITVIPALRSVRASLFILPHSSALFSCNPDHAVRIVSITTISGLLKLIQLCRLLMPASSFRFIILSSMNGVHIMKRPSASPKERRDLVRNLDMFCLLFSKSK